MPGPGICQQHQGSPLLLLHCLHPPLLARLQGQPQHCLMPTSRVLEYFMEGQRAPEKCKLLMMSFGDNLQRYRENGCNGPQCLWNGFLRSPPAAQGLVKWVQCYMTLRKGQMDFTCMATDTSRAQGRQTDPLSFLPLPGHYHHLFHDIRCQVGFLPSCLFSDCTVEAYSVCPE